MAALTDRLNRADLPKALSIIADVAAVMVFVVLGRATHDGTGGVSALVAAVSPFLVGLGVAWGLIRWRSHAAPRRVLHGITLAVVTVIVAMPVRALWGQSVGGDVVGLLTFGGVAIGMLILLLVGWRAVAALLLPPPDRTAGDERY